MVCRTRISDCQKYILIEVESDITHDIAMTFMQQACEAASSQGIRNYFFDVRGIRNIESTENNYHLINEEAARLGFGRGSKIAILVDLNDASHDFIETAAISAGYNCKIFTDEATLLEWIQI